MGVVHDTANEVLSSKMLADKGNTKQANSEVIFSLPFSNVLGTRKIMASFSRMFQCYLFVAAIAKDVHITSIYVIINKLVYVT